VTAGAVTERIPLPTLLSQVLVAFTIEFDNEAEHRVQHWTTDGTPAGARRGVWLTSQVMWANFMQFIPAEGIPLAEVEGMARLTNLAGLKRWRYVDLGPERTEVRAGPPSSDLVVRPTKAGLRAQQIWRPLAGEVEQRWRERFGEAQIGRLLEALGGFARRSEIDLPQYLPVVAYGMRIDPDRLRAGAASRSTGAVDDLSALLSKVLLMFTIDFERGSKLSLPISANALRALGENAVRVRELPRLTGVSKEAIAMSLGFLEKIGCVVVGPDPSASRGKAAHLSAKGVKAQHKYRRVLAETEAQWRERFGEEQVTGLRAPLEGLVGEPGVPSPLSQGLQSYPEGWRSSVRRPEILPHYPMVLHRGGWPDGS
jgi:DNA-binding MarR family transcriptional regulator